MEIILLTVIAAMLVIVVLGDFQAHLFPEKWLKKFHYRRSRYSVLRNLWDVEFKRDSCESAREAERVVYDRVSEQIAAFQVRIEKLKDRSEAGDADDIKNSEQKIQELLNARKMHQDQMDELDAQMKQLGKNVDDLRSVVGLVEDKIRKS